jgi:hypothetical protein
MKRHFPLPFALIAGALLVQPAPKIAEQRAEVRREADLREAEAKGDPVKIAKRQAKREEARAEFDAADKALER